MDAEELPIALKKKLLNVFLPDALTRLCRHPGPGKPRTAKIDLTFDGDATSAGNAFSFEISVNTDSARITATPTERPTAPTGGPVFLPPREVVSLTPAFVSDYENTSIRFEETY